MFKLERFGTEEEMRAILAFAYKRVFGNSFKEKILISSGKSNFQTPSKPFPGIFSFYFEKDHILVKAKGPSFFRKRQFRVLKETYDYYRRCYLEREKSRAAEHIDPPWVVYPGYPPGDSFWRQVGEPYLHLKWIPFWESRTPDQKAAFYKKYSYHSQKIKP